MKSQTQPQLGNRRWLDTIEFAARLHCHPMSIPKFRKKKKDFPRPIKPFNKNLWAEDEVEAYEKKIFAKREE
jgi:nitrogenase molybdenum-iron protein alpha/beta subunit